VSELAAKAFVLALAVAATALIGFAGLAGGGDEPGARGRRGRRFVARMKALGDFYAGRSEHGGRR
jgi:hypothetical protein